MIRYHDDVSAVSGDEDDTGNAFSDEDTSMDFFGGFSSSKAPASLPLPHLPPFFVVANT